MIRTLSPRSLLATLALTCGAFPAAAWSQSAGGFDHRHAAWDQLLRRHVVVAADGTSSTLRYRALAVAACAPAIAR